MGVEGPDSEREEERHRERSLGGDTREWIKRALLLYKHRGMTGALHMEKAHKHGSLKGYMDTCMNTRMLFWRLRRQADVVMEAATECIPIRA